jgi:hypothetical protein
MNWIVYEHGDKKKYSSKNKRYKLWIRTNGATGFVNWDVVDRETNYILTQWNKEYLSLIMET